MDFEQNMVNIAETTIVVTTVEIPTIATEEAFTLVVSL